MQGGGIVRFFHRKHECYIVAEGSFAGRFATLKTIEELVKKREKYTSSLAIPETDKTHRMSTENNVEDPSESHPITLGPHSQVVEVEVHDVGGDTDDTPFQNVPVPSYSIDRSFSREDSLNFGVASRQAALSEVDSCSVTNLLDKDLSPDTCIVTHDGKHMTYLCKCM